LPHALRAATALLLLSSALSPFGCARATPRPASLIVPPSADAQDAARRIADRARDAEIVYLGEQHDNPIHHDHQRRVLAALLERGVRPAVGFEMLDRDQQSAMDRALADAPSAEELARRLRWREGGWPDFAMYWPLFELAVRAQLPVAALDLDRARTRRIAREGLAALGPEAAELRSRLAPDPTREAALGREIEAAHCGLLPAARVPGMIEAWHARNVAMARGLVDLLARHRQVVVIVGRGHQQPGGLPAQVAALRPGTRQLVVDLAEAPAGADPASAASGSAADVVWLTSAMERPDPCESLRRAPQLLR